MILVYGKFEPLCGYFLGPYRNISNELSIETKLDRKSSGLEHYALEQGWWHGKDTFNFKQIFSMDSGKLYFFLHVV